MLGKLVAPSSTACIAACFLILAGAASSDDVNIVSRNTWGAVNAKFKNYMTSTATHLIVHHTVTASCSGAACYRTLRSIQSGHINLTYGDIGYNFLIGQNGTIYEGQGFGRKAAHAGRANRYSIGVSFIGNFETASPSQASITALSNFISYAVQQGYLSSDYKLVGHRSVKATACPGKNLYDEISKLKNFSKTL